MRILLFEDHTWRRMLPLTALRSVNELRCGILPLWKKATLRLNGDVHGISCRPEVAAAWTIDPPDLPVNVGQNEETLWLNVRVLWDGELLEEARRLDRGGRIVDGDGSILAAVATLAGDEEDLPGRIEEATEPSREVEWPQVSTWYDLLAHNAAEIERDALLLGLPASASPPAGITVVGDGWVWVSEGATLGPNTVLDTRKGPIVVEEGVEVLPGSYLEGPCFVGHGSTVRVGAALYSGCSIGPNCKVGGELDHVLLLGYANKQHEGYLGNAILAPWVNIGAGTHNSDLKNTYGPVQTYVDGESVNTGMRFLGCCLGEHTKTSIGTVLNTGSVVGVGCNLFGSGFHPTRVEDFVWGQPGNYKEHRLENMIETARIVMDRRGVSWTEEYEQLVRAWHESSAPRRAEFLSRRMHRRSG